MLKVFIGFDKREPLSYAKAESSLLAHASIPVSVTPLNVDHLRSCGLFNRPISRCDGKLYDLISQGYASTEFAFTRFLTPILAQSGMALFVDCDVIFLSDVAELVSLPTAPLRVVKHKQKVSSTSKMDGQIQMPYPRKNWSSVMLFNCDDAANRRLTVDDVNARTGLELHNFYWLADSEIADLPLEWNWLVGIQDAPEFPKIAHFTLGTPELGVSSAHDEIWRLA